MKKITVPLAILLVLLLFNFYFFPSINDSPSLTPDKHSPNSPNRTFEHLIKKNVDTIQINKKANYKSRKKETKNNGRLTPEKIIALNGWMWRQGYTSIIHLDGTVPLMPDEQPYNEYDDYDIETLKAMSINDPRATLELGLRYAGNNYNFIEAKKYLYQSAINGYGRTSEDFSFLYGDKATREFNLGNKEQANEDFILAYAWSYIKNIRFSPGNDKTDIAGLEYQFENQPQHLIELKNKARIKAHKIYKDLQNKREQQGLGEFDNSIPDMLKDDWKDIFKSL